MRCSGGLALAALSALAQAGWAQQRMPWEREALVKAPQVFAAPDCGHGTNGVRALFYEGEPYRGKPTRVFAYYGCPASEPGKRLPAVVLVHGGGGTAFPQWVRLWNGRGYAALAMDLCGSVPNPELKWPYPCHDWAGPDGKSPILHAGDPERDQWPYHAVAAAVRANSLLRSLPEVDPARVGIMGISWGGYVTCIAAAIDSRFAFAVPVYGCGFLSDNSMWLDDFKKIGDASAKKWTALWDPSSYLPLAEVPFLWVTGSNDRAYPMDSLRKSCRLLKAPGRLCVKVRMPHGHGFHIAESFAFADSFAFGKPPLPRFVAVSREDRRVTAVYKTARPVVKAELNYTLDRGGWTQRLWQTVPATFDPASGTVQAELPNGATVYYINLVIETGLVVSTAYEES